MRKIIIAGGPHTGKTTLLKALEYKFPEAYFVPEPAETLIARELLKQERDHDYVPVLPWIDYKLFGPAVTQESVALESKIPPHVDLAFQDRSLIDAIGYCRLNHFNTFIIKVKRLIDEANYGLAFFCEPVGDYLTTDIRRESYSQAKRTHQFLQKAYQESGIPVIELPPVPVHQRIEIVQTNIKA